MTLTAYAPPKINLSLKIIGKKESGYHLLESIVVFGAHNSGDMVHYAPEAKFGLQVTGIFADKVPSDASNLILKICDIVNAERVKLKQSPLEFGGFTLEKKLPIASGIGGGTMDAMAALELIQQHHNLPDEFCLHCAKILGADGAACWHGKPLIMRGIGDKIELLPANVLDNLPKFCVLLNANVAVNTGEVFKAFSAALSYPLWVGSTLTSAKKMDSPHKRENEGFTIQMLQELDNDLQAPAIQICPEIADVLAFLAQNRAEYHAMSGSGGTCFGLFETEIAAHNAFNAAPNNWWKCVFKF